MFTLVGAGVKPVSATCRSEESVLPAGAKWLQDSAQTIDAENCRVTTANGDVINYEYIVIAVGLNNDYSKVRHVVKCKLYKIKYYFIIITDINTFSIL